MRLNLRPTSPCGNHGNSPVAILNPILASTTPKGVGAIETPGLVSERLQIRGERTAEDSIGLKVMTVSRIPEVRIRLEYSPQVGPVG